MRVFPWRGEIVPDQGFLCKVAMCVGMDRFKGKFWSVRDAVATPVVGFSGPGDRSYQYHLDGQPSLALFASDPLNGTR